MIDRPILTAEDVSVALGGRTVLEAVRLEMMPGELVVVVGPNGAGKTTLVRALAGLVAYRGKIVVDRIALGDLSPGARARKIAYLPQGQTFHWPMPVSEIVALGRLPHGGGASGEDRKAIGRAMQACGVTGFADRPVTTLSGGERSRVALARVLAVESDIVLADEPTASLDPRYQLTVLELLRDRARAGKAVATVLHDLALASRFADRIVMLAGGKVLAAGRPDEVLTEDRIGDAFGVTAAVIERDGVRVAIPWSVRAP